jgi:hypothetical protein
MVFKMADMVRGYQRLTTLDRDALRPAAWLPGGHTGTVQLGEPELPLLKQLGRLPATLRANPQLSDTCTARLKESLSFHDPEDRSGVDLS